MEPSAFGFLKTGKFWIITVAIALLTLASILMNWVVFPLFDTVFPPARDISVAFSALFMLVLGALAAVRPQTMRFTNRYNAMVGLLAVVGSMGMLLALVWENAPLLVVMSAALAMGRAGITVSTGLAALGMQVREISVSSAVGLTLAYVLAAVFSVSEEFAGLLMFLVAPLIAFVLVVRAADASLIESQSDLAPADIAVTHPSTYIPLAGQMFVCIFVFHAAYGFSLRLGETAGTPVSDLLVLVPLALVLVIMLIWNKPIKSDLLAQVAVLFIVGGLFLAGAPRTGLHLTANVLLSSGNALFGIVVWTVLVTVGTRNKMAAVSVISWGRGLGAVGSVVGALFGVSFNWLAAENPQASVLVVGVVLVLFVGYQIIGLKNFSFAGTVANIEPVAEELEAKVDPQADFDARCDAVASKFGLTPREREVFAMLARGRDRTYIEEQLVVSRNTVKAHVKHIYAKLDIHSQQDLIDVFESTAL